MDQQDTPKLTRVQEVINAAYSDDDMIRNYIEEPDIHHGDTLAEFIVREITDCDGWDDLLAAENAMSMALGELSRVHTAIIKLISEQNSKKKFLTRIKLQLGEFEKVTYTLVVAPDRETAITQALEGECHSENPRRESEFVIWDDEAGYCYELQSCHELTDNEFDNISIFISPVGG